MFSSFSSIAAIYGVLMLQPGPSQANQAVYIPASTWTAPNLTEAEQRVLWMPLACLEDQGFNTTANFTQWQEDKGYKTLRNFIDNGNYTMTSGADQMCGWTNPKGIPQQIPDDNSMRTSGCSRYGPCEIWLDDTLTFSNFKCQEALHDVHTGLDYSGSASCTGTPWVCLDQTELTRGKSTRNAFQFT